jgi:hypothetical protein
MPAFKQILRISIQTIATVFLSHTLYRIKLVIGILAGALWLLSSSTFAFNINPNSHTTDFHTRTHCQRY